jgi:excinuclease ABC subunit C
MEKPDLSAIPTSPGVYRYYNQTGKIIYVGKAKNLRNRLGSYFNNQQGMHPRTQKMVNEADHIEWTIVNSELESLNLEWSLIKEYSPKYNVDFNFDDRSYYYLAFTYLDKHPRVFLTRKPRQKRIKYFGPFPKSWAIKKTLDYLLKIYPLRTCSVGTYNQAVKQQRNCLLGDIGKCSAPCVGKVTDQEYRETFDNFVRFFRGNANSIVRNLERQMKIASADEQYEKAAKFRDNIQALETVLQKNSIVINQSENIDIVVTSANEIESAYCALIIREGRIRSQISTVIESADELSPEELIEKVLLNHFDNYPDYSLPKQVYINVTPGAVEQVTALINGKLNSNLTLQLPKRGKKLDLVQLAINNANECLRLESLKHATSLEARTKGLEQLTETLELTNAPYRIEGYDISTTLTKFQVSSMVVFVDGKPKKSEYRKFKIKEAIGDVPSLKEVMYRRFNINVDTTASTEKGTGASKDWDLPDLLVIDGGKPQVDAVASVLQELEIEIPVIGLAKRLEEVYTPGSEYPIIFPRQSEALYLLMQVRDESHRFAITYHRKLRGKNLISA